MCQNESTYWVKNALKLLYSIASRLIQQALIILLITTLGTLGSCFSLIGVLMAIAIAEMYLQAKRAIV